MEVRPDVKNSSGEWVQRTTVHGRYLWTTSGVAWNNIKERCTPGGATQRREPTYVGCKNDFSNFQQFVDWHVAQAGYGLGYQLDSDVLRKGMKVYSAETCVLVPPSLNKFLQSYTSKRGKWPQGMYLSKAGRLVASVNSGGTKYSLGSFSVADIDSARAAYKAAKDKLGAEWAVRLDSGEFTVDPRVISFMRAWRYTCEWGNV